MQDFNVLLEAASDYNEFVGSGAEEDRNALRHFEGLANEALPDDVISKLSQLPGSYSILVAAEMWCPDCQKKLACNPCHCRVNAGNTSGYYHPRQGRSRL